MEEKVRSGANSRANSRAPRKEEDTSTVNYKDKLDAEMKSAEEIPVDGVGKETVDLTSEPGGTKKAEGVAGAVDGNPLDRQRRRSRSPSTAPKPRHLAPKKKTTGED